MRNMDLRLRFDIWVEECVGSAAAPALRQHLRTHDYRLYSRVEYAGRCTQEVYHPDRGFYRATGRNDAEALLGILRQIWLVDSITGAPAPEVGP
jgi:hypothetical protein